MTLDSLIAIIGLALAAYAIMPRHRQLDILLRLRRRDWFVIILCLATVHYLFFFEVFRSLGITPRLALHRYGLEPAAAAYALLFLLATFIYFELRYFKLSPRRMTRFKELIESLLLSGNHQELTGLLDRHLENLLSISGNYSWVTRLRRWLNPEPHYDLALVLKDDGQSEFARIAKRLPSAVVVILKILPDHEVGARAAREVIQRILTSARFSTSIAESHPYFGLRLLSIKVHEVFDFQRLYLSALIRQPGSVWYSELRNNQNVGVGSKYAIPEGNRLLYFLLHDARVAENLSVYKPVGDLMLTDLDRLAKTAPEEDEYNWAMDDFRENGRWDSSLWTGIFFFDIMISTALYQNIQWHMWLYYLPMVVEAMVKNFRLVEGRSEPDAEFPNRYAFLISESMYDMASWIEAVRYISPDQDNIKLNSIEAEHDNGNIPKSAILALGQCCRTIVAAASLPERLKRHLVDIGVQLYFTLRSIPHGSDYATVLAKSLRNGGGWIHSSRELGHRQFLLEVLDRHDLRIGDIQYKADLEAIIAA